MRKDAVLNMFTNKVKFVKPLYKRARHIDNDETKILAIKFDSSIDLRGDGVYVKRHVNTGSELNTFKNKYFKTKGQVTLPGVCETNLDNITCMRLNTINKKTNNKSVSHEDNYTQFEVTNKGKYSKMEESESVPGPDRGVSFKKNRHPETISKQIVLHKVSDAWLRVYPAPSKPDESTCSIIIRCVFCQLGLIAVLVIWNIIWVFVINSFEGPQEVKVSLDFEKEQNQLVIDLATELRQIAPLSSRWREAIEKRIEDERKLTMLAVGKGAKLNPGLFWDLPGTFLFSVYVMTALGFGAPVPHTVWGRMSALIYAILAVPTHIYLMWNASTCVVVNIERCTKSLKRKYSTRKIDKPTLENMKESSNSSGKSDVPEKSCFVNKVCMFGVLCSGHCILLTISIYYICGVVLFGVLRSKMPLEIIMFPLEFTTTGGLENVEGHIRILYGFYVEGAMCLLACALANVRRLSSSPVACMLENYRLFYSPDCNECDKHEDCRMTRVS